jgi:hypothetical protein
MLMSAVAEIYIGALLAVPAMNHNKFIENRKNSLPPAKTKT